MNDDLLTVLVARCGSDRFPGKVVAEVAGLSLLAWIIRRLKVLEGELVVATTANPEDDPIETIACSEGVNCYRHPGRPDDVVGRIHEVVKSSKAKLLFKALGDCPFVSVEVVMRAAQVLRRTGAELFLWSVGNGNIWPVYGAREFPITRRAWAKVVASASGQQREHPDMYINEHREEFDIIYHDPPGPTYYRHPDQMRLEVDWPEDLQLVRAVAERGPGMLAPLNEVIHWLDDNQDVAGLNRHRKEKTGPVISYEPKLQRQWFRLARATPVYTWDDEIVSGSANRKKASPIFCDGCNRLLGQGFEGRLYLREDDVIIDTGRVNCPNCGHVRPWRKSL